MDCIYMLISGFKFWGLEDRNKILFITDLSFKIRIYANQINCKWKSFQISTSYRRKQVLLTGKVGKYESGERFLLTGTWSPGNCSSKGDLPSKNKYIGQEEGKTARWEKVRKTFPLFIIKSKKKKGLTVIGSPPIGCRFIHKKRKYRPVEKNQVCFCFLLLLAANYWFVFQKLFSISL